jgi:uncharacterized coiled-coil DUF342 family protein
MASSQSPKLGKQLIQHTAKKESLDATSQRHSRKFPAFVSVSIRMADKERDEESSLREELDRLRQENQRPIDEYNRVVQEFHRIRGQLEELKKRRTRVNWKQGLGFVNYAAGA